MRGLPLLLLLLLAPAAGALPEDQAPSSHPLVMRAWHEPEPVRAGEQWHGYLQLREGHGFHEAWYQVCTVSDGQCFAPPHQAQDVGNGTFRFDTRDYLANGRPVDYEAGWRIGVRWFLAETPEGPAGNGTWIPRPPPSPTDLVPIADLYLTFDIPGGSDQGAPGAPAALLAAALALAAARRRP